jgi:hypothetical protein
VDFTNRTHSLNNALMTSLKSYDLFPLISVERTPSHVRSREMISNTRTPLTCRSPIPLFTSNSSQGSHQCGILTPSAYNLPVRVAQHKSILIARAIQLLLLQSHALFLVFARPKYLDFPNGSNMAIPTKIQVANNIIVMTEVTHFIPALSSPLAI